MMGGYGDQRDSRTSVVMKEENFVKSSQVNIQPLNLVEDNEVKDPVENQQVKVGDQQVNNEEQKADPALLQADPSYCSFNDPNLINDMKCHSIVNDTEINEINNTFDFDDKQQQQSEAK